MLSEQLFNERTISRLPVDANGVLHASFNTYLKLLNKPHPFTNAVHTRLDRHRLRDSLKGHFKSSSRIMAGSINWAAEHSLIGPEQVLTWAAESLKASDWRGIQLAPVVGYVWDEWSRKGRYTDPRQRLRCIKLLGQIRKLLSTREGLKDTSTPDQWKRQQGGNQDV